MEKYYKERFEAQRGVAKKIAQFMEVNDILEAIREEIRIAIPSAMEACILLLDPDAKKYTRPLQCALYDRPARQRVQGGRTSELVRARQAALRRCTRASSVA